MMSEEKNESDLSSWMSTYGLITANRTLELYHIHLQAEELQRAIRNPESFYHRILRIPLRNIFHGIILEQAKDYQVYAQKMFIDYLMSGESSKPEEAPGGFTREDLEKERKTLVGMADDFELCEADYFKIIAQSQKMIIQKAEAWLKLILEAVSEIQSNLASRGIKKTNEVIRKTVNVLMVFPEFTSRGKINLTDSVWSRVEKLFGETLSSDLRQLFVEKINNLRELNISVESELQHYFKLVDEMGAIIRSWRSKFYTIILRVTELLKQLPEYQSNQAQILENQAALYFDTGIGEQK